MSKEQLETSCRGLDLGHVEAVDEPFGVSWLNFGGLALSDYGPYKPEEGETYRSTVPVPTKDLIDRKGAHPIEGNFFYAEVNGDATSMADVNPYVTEFSDPSPELLKEFDNPTGE
ncbi:MAG: hypothetical protein WBP26_05140 [Candidatus Saccharimonadales bacterium]